MAESSSAKKAGIAIILLVVAGGLAYSRMQKLTPNAAINNGVSSDEGPSPADFQEVAKKANITPQQQEKMQEAREKGEYRQIFDVLTTDQRTVMFQEFRSRRAKQEAKMKAALGDQYDKYQAKRQERRGSWGGRGGGGTGGNRGGDNRGGGPRT